MCVNKRTKILEECQKSITLKKRNKQIIHISEDKTTEKQQENARERLEYCPAITEIPYLGITILKMKLEFITFFAYLRLLFI